ncbi:hypothetical protein FT643_09795 [Ketobacter sp. MCCC 1A13808]|uniref:SurA N-terminal domain-containing protein n=1 Tax=Ketobacter sp. MCCC 1A13808 TaxID=2602738 RepID=UPI0012EB871E|nr:SurA N-terminal domain-containing protein [Ketobacter sp. MCCC 1A13808]MVF12435.1 hypothetical protein [Ketobacter sp. MCCC 1A13808]
MQQFRNLLKGWLGKVLLVIFILPFAFFGIEGLFNSGGSADVAIKVNDAEISTLEVNRAIENQRENLKQQMGGNIDDSFLTDELLKPRVVESLIQRELIKQAVEEEGLAVSADRVKSYVRSMPQFQDESGNFSNDRLESLLVQANFTKARLFETIQESMVFEQLQNGVGATAFITPSELNYAVKLNNQKRDFSYAIQSAEALKEKVELTEDELQAYFEQNKSQFRTQEKVKIQYIQLGKDDFEKSVTVPEEEITAAYHDYENKLKQQERRRASHILVEINDDRSDSEAMKRIKEAQAKLVEGQSFEKVVSEYSDDIATTSDGGDLDYNGKGVFDEDFENALFALDEKGDVSDIVKSEFGYHIIKLTGIEQPEIVSLEDKRQELVKEIKSDMAQEKLEEAIDDINRLAFESGDLQLISDDYKKPIQTSDFFTRQGGKGVAADRAVIDAAFSDIVLNDGQNSEIIELSNGKVVVIRLAQHEQARDQEFKEVESQIRSVLVLEKSREQAKSKAEAVIAKLKDGASRDTIAEEFGLEWKQGEGVSRQGSDLPQTVVSAAFEMPVPATGGQSIKHFGQPNGDQEIIILSRVVDGEFDLEGEQLAQAKASASQRFGNSDFANYIASLREKAKIEIR